MAGVPDQVLRWLYNALKPEYRDVNRAYSDVVQTLKEYNTLAPRTEIYTFDDGTSSLLLVLNGTLPVLFRGSAYNFPIAVWIPHDYPSNAPMIFVIPTRDMVVRPGQHISVEGRVYHPYLAQWAGHWDKSNVCDVLLILRDVFAKEPPLVSGQQQVALRDQQGQLKRSPPPIPPTPEQRQQNVHSSRSDSTIQPVAPAPPPKVSEVSTRVRPELARMLVSASKAPALPPKPGALQTNGFNTSPSPVYSPGSDRKIHQQAPLHPPTPTGAFQRDAQYISVPQAVPLVQAQAPRDQQYQSTMPPTLDSASPVQLLPPLAQLPTGQLRSQPSPSATIPQNKIPQPRKPVEDLLSSTFDVNLQLQNQSQISMLAPPIPPNPEKDALLQAISTALRTRLDQLLNQNTSACASLVAQTAALQSTHAKLSNEMAQLQQLDETLSSNEQILRDTMRDADKLMESVSKREVPNVDDVLVAPTVVGEQLYRLAADEKGIEDAMFALTKALDAGRVSGDVYLRQTRSLAREQFLKKALIRKIAKGMGLALDEFRH